MKRLLPIVLFPSAAVFSAIAQPVSAAKGERRLAIICINRAIARATGVSGTESADGTTTFKRRG